MKIICSRRSDLNVKISKRKNWFREREREKEREREREREREIGLGLGLG